SARVSKQFAEHYDLPVGPAFFDVQNACNGVFSAIQIADGLVRTGAYSNVLIVSGETGDAATRAATDAITAFAEHGVDPHGLGPDISNHVRHYAACYTLGSIGAATVVSAQPTDQSLELMGIQMAADSNSAELCILASQEHPLVVDPPMLLEVAAPFAITSFKAFMRERNNSIDSLEHLFVHQPSKSTIADYSTGLSYPIEKIVETVTRFGNVITCSTLLGWDRVSQGLRSGDLVGANIVGSGISSGSLLLRCV
ncbi:MAG: 3-oxoacyl-[acyl-carrier-protein] synthase III C-terminal domain-containing protein, partial [Pseudomonadota bacterium]